jgi:Arc/MetJ-type ribon-helix-helix transcriptional regulator
MPSNAGENTPKEKQATPKITVAMTPEMLKDLEEERKSRRIATVPEVVRIIVSEYLKAKG